MRTHRPFLLALTLAAVTACGGIADPTHGEGSTQTVSGALTGSASLPTNARVALVWKVGDTGTWAVGADVPVVNGQFAMTLTAPPDAYFSAESLDATKNSATVDAPPSGTVANGSGSSGGGTAPSPTLAPPSGGTGAMLHATDTVSGQISGDLRAAIAGFVVYADTNGNGALDLTGEYLSTSDEILGGNKDLFLAYLKGGGALDYEILRDRSGIAPQQGYNLAWLGGRWLGLDLVELKLASTTKLPSPVCESTAAAPTTSFGEGSSGGSTRTGGVDDAGVATDDADVSNGPMQPGGYPDPSQVTCSPDGRSWTLNGTPTCTPPPSPPPGLCSPDAMPYGCAGISGSSLAPGQDPPPGWPCTVDADASATPPPDDAGPAPDAAFDAGTD